MLGASAMAHIVLVGVFVFVPAWWFGAENKPPETIMQISLGGPVGPNDGGAGDARRPHHSAGRAGRNEEADRAGAAAVGEDAGDDRADQGAAEEDDAEQGRGQGSAGARGRRRARRFRKGSSIAETGAKGMGFGLSSGGGGGGGHLEVSNFCCPEYLDDDGRL